MKVSALFLGLEKQKQERIKIIELINKNGKILTNEDEIITEIHDYYAELFSSIGNNILATECMLNNIDKKLTREDKDYCDSPINEGEIIHAINNLNRNKSLGKKTV